MTSLRESKKRATRQAMSDAAARLALDGGAEAVTVSGITSAVGVSPRTFHNYFSSVADSLLHYTADVLEAFAEGIPTAFPGEPISSVLELTLIDALDNEYMELRSLHSLFKIGEAMENLSHTAEEKKKFDSVIHRIIAAFQERYPEYSTFELTIILNACGSTGNACQQELKRRCEMGKAPSKRERDELVHHAFATLRGLV
ncbi:TetR/AcrR family transcriptional regulator [Corynebacterium accolens]|uniref:TetR/AcrR family transcriptional regulator n=1 Tax=Corynebacterium accolens TaxID=38284 RepID=UPI00254BE63F|nr:TetR/AcrR family transcriptional regulator [Corynebacterium accolens]MDK8711881.1 TetR/AcrR family transcriptional regulator [Corynebacterium accolens]MDK8784859.1 TetR/AcrR family transcriptional regulator [Corynebacterium accolens]